MVDGLRKSSTGRSAGYGRTERVRSTFPRCGVLGKVQGRQRVQVERRLGGSMDSPWCCRPVSSFTCSHAGWAWSKLLRYFGSIDRRVKSRAASPSGGKAFFYGRRISTFYGKACFVECGEKREVRKLEK